MAPLLKLPPERQLAIEGLLVRYGGVTALDAVSLEVRPRTVVGLIGPNGAGKTTLINAVTGVVRASGGSIVLGGTHLERLPQHQVARSGVARTYQNIRLFANLSVADNVCAGAIARPGRLTEADVRALLGRVGLDELPAQRRAGSLAYGQQRRLEIARALAEEPAILMLDEPAAGMNPAETRELRDLIRSIAEDGTGVLLVEHDMSLVSAVCDHVVVLSFGEVIARGTPHAVARDPLVVEAYLGTGAA